MLNKHEWFWRVYAMSDDTKMLKDPSINDAERLIRKLEACEGIAAKLVLLRNFCDKYSAGRAAREPKSEWSVDTLKRLSRKLRAEKVEMFNRVKELERQLAEVREALVKISKSTCEYCLCKEIAEAALRQNEEK